MAGWVVRAGGPCQVNPPFRWVRISVLILNKLPPAGPPRPQVLRSDAAPARAVASTPTHPLHHPLGTEQACPLQKQMNRLLTRPCPLLRSLNRAPLSHLATARMDYSSVPTPERCYADFCLVPVTLIASLPPPVPHRSSSQHISSNTPGISCPKRPGTNPRPFAGRHGRAVRGQGGRRGAEAAQGVRPDVHDALGRHDGRGQLGRGHEGHRPGSLGRPPGRAPADPDLHAGRDKVSFSLSGLGKGGNDSFARADSWHRTDKKQTAADKVKRVEDLLAEKK